MVEFQQSNGQTESLGCVHHYIIGKPANGIAVGTCKKCDVTRYFTQTAEDNIATDFYEKRKIANARKRNVSGDTTIRPVTQSDIQPENKPNLQTK